jgi:sugar (pentulose or hexulose) kinase
MDIYTIGIDLGKTTFHLVGLNEKGEVVARKKFSPKAIAALPCEPKGISDWNGSVLWRSTFSGPCTSRARTRTTL